ncbi:unnamed protein product [Allacma fusca]|uniref:BED-type domain-containing protein n=1 Tax=Allacma fusca TaxID=39272 RepID=A0A8J2PJX5_9HEXA|nr:unnamed protein product [Allacma fusca]
MSSEEEHSVVADHSKPKTKSKVHEHFTFNDKENMYKCSYCFKLFKKEKSSGTGNLLKHLRRLHSKKYAESKCEESIKGPIEAAFSKQAFSAEEYNRKLVEFILLTDQPFSIVEAESFFNLMKYGRSQPIPNRFANKKKIEEMFATEKQKIKELLKAAPGKVSIVVDCWTTRNGGSHKG